MINIEYDVSVSGYYRFASLLKKSSTAIKSATAVVAAGRCFVRSSQLKRTLFQTLSSLPLSHTMSSRSTKSSVPASSRGKAAAAAGASNKTRAVRSPGPVGRAPAIKSNNATRKRLRKQSTGEDSDADVSAVADDGAAAAASLTVGDDSVGLDQLQLATPKSSPSKKARSRAGETKVIPTSSRVLFGNSKGQLRSAVMRQLADMYRSVESTDISSPHLLFGSCVYHNQDLVAAQLLKPLPLTATMSRLLQHLAPITWRTMPSNLKNRLTRTTTTLLSVK